MRVATALLLLLPSLLWAVGCNPVVDQGDFSRPLSHTGATQSQGTPWLEDVSSAVGLDFTRQTEAEGSYFMPEIMGSGGGFLDFDLDGLLDIVLLEAVWDYHFDPQTNVIDVHISRLRQRVDKGFQQSLIHTIRGAGYRLAAEG